MFGRRKSVALGCIVLILAAAILPLGGMSLDWLVVTPAFVLLPPITPAAVLPSDIRPDEQTVALLAILDARGPPKTPRT